MEYSKLVGISRAALFTVVPDAHRSNRSVKTHSMFRFILCVLLILASSPCRALAVEQPEFEIKGTAEWCLTTHGGVLSRRTFEFSLKTDRNGWSITQTPGETGRGPIEKAGSDNESTYRYMDNRYITKGDTLKQFGTVCLGTYPADASKELKVLWLAFLSPFHPTNLTSPIHLTGNDVGSTNNLSLILATNSGFCLLQHMVSLVDPANTYITSNDNFEYWDIAVSDHFTPPHPPIAQKVTYSQYDLVSPHHRSKIFEGYISVDSIKPFRSHSPHDFLPEIPDSHLEVLDYRFSAAGVPNHTGTQTDLAEYYVEDGKWLSYEQATKYAGHLLDDKPPIQPQPNRPHHYLLWTTIAAAALGLTAIVCRKRRTVA